MALSVLMINVYVLGDPKKCIFYFLFKRVEGLFSVVSLFGVVFFEVGLIFIFILLLIFILFFFGRGEGQKHIKLGTSISKIFSYVYVVSI